MFESQTLVVNAENPCDDNFHSKLFRKIEDHDLEIWDIVTTRFDEDQANYFEDPKLRDNSCLVIQCFGEKENAKNLEKDIEQTLGANYEKTFLLKIFPYDADHFISTLKLNNIKKIKK